MKLSDFDVRSFGTDLTISGVCYDDRHGHRFLLRLPEYGQDDDPVTVVDLDLEGWQRVLKQLDVVEVEVLAKAADVTLTKAILRKCERMISGQVSWNVFKRDSFRCRYCGRGDVPLTVDHLVLYEEMGPSTEANLLAVCKKDNKARGRMQYVDWLQSEYYQRVSKNLSALVRADNLELIETLNKIERVDHVRSR